MSDRPAAEPEFTTRPTAEESSPSADEFPISRRRSSVVRTRVIPAIAGLMLLAIIGVIVWAMVAPESARSDIRQRIGNVIVYEEPRLATDFTLPYLNRGGLDSGGDDFQLSDLRGQTVILNFWASWCGPCEAEMPVLKQASQELADEGVVVIGVNTLDDRPAAENFIEELAVEYPNVIDRGEGEIAVEYGVAGVPETFVVGPDGNLVAHLLGTVESVQDVRDLAALAQ